MFDVSEAGNSFIHLFFLVRGITSDANSDAVAGAAGAVIAAITDNNWLKFACHVGNYAKVIASNNRFPQFYARSGRELTV